jgi:hypothetical protein
VTSSSDPIDVIRPFLTAMPVAHGWAGFAVQIRAFLMTRSTMSSIPWVAASTIAGSLLQTFEKGVSHGKTLGRAATGRVPKGSRLTHPGMGF